LRNLKDNLLLQFSVASFVIIFTIAMITLLLITASLDLATGVAILILYFALIAIVWRGWRTITQQRADLELAMAGLETRVAERVEELRKANFRLQSEIGERRAAEDALAQTNRRLEETLEELGKTQRQVVQQERMQAMGQMASGVAHDFNNALGPIMFYADLILEVPGALDKKEELISYLKIMRTSAVDASNVVRRLSEFYRGPSSSDAVEAVNVNEIIENSISLTQPRWKDQAQAEGISIDIHTDLQEVPLFAANGSDLREVLMNLILNAVHAMPAGGTITLGTRHEGDQVAIEVSDTGTGMTEEVRQRCMDPFFTTKGERGSGLGLAMVYGIVQRSGGEIDLESELGKGTRFTIRLPLETVAHAESKVARSSTPPPSLHILAVDDDSTGLQALTEALHAMGHTVDSATNGREGLEKFRSGNYDLVVTDRAMPEMNGDQLAAAIKELVPDKQVIMMTGFGDIMEDTGERPQGVDSVLSKPVSLASLREALLELGA